MNIKNVGKRQITDISSEVRAKVKKFKTKKEKSMKNV